MNSLAANRTTARPLPPSSPPRLNCSFVEDLNWPVPPVPDRKKTTRPTEMWVPGRGGQWQRTPPTLE